MPTRLSLGVGVTAGGARAVAGDPVTGLTATVESDRTVTLDWTDPASSFDELAIERQTLNDDDTPADAFTEIDRVSPAVETFNDPFSLGVSGGGENEPAGMEAITDFDGTSQLFGTGWSAMGAAKMTDNHWNEVVADAANPKGSGFALEHRYYTDEDGDTGNGLQQLSHFRVPMKEIYCRQRVKWSANWDVDPTYGGMKVGYMGIQGWSDSPTTFFYGIGNVTPPGTPPWPMYFQDQSGEADDVFSFGDPPLVNLNEWVTIEWHQVAQSAKDVADGSFKMWVNGTLVINLTSCNFISGSSTYADVNFDGFQWFPIRGAFGSVRRVDDSFRQGEFYLSGKAA